MATENGEKNKGGRPRTGIGPNIGLRLYPELAAAVDAWIAKQPDPKPSRPEAIRRPIGRGPNAEGKGTELILGLGDPDVISRRFHRRR